MYAVKTDLVETDPKSAMKFFHQVIDIVNDVLAVDVDKATEIKAHLDATGHIMHELAHEIEK